MTHSALPLSPSDVVIIAVVLPTLALIAFTLRVLDRRRRHVSASWHEWTLAAGLLFLWSLAITCFVGVGIGALGRHSQPPSPHDKPGATIHRGEADVKAARVVRSFSVLEKVTFYLIKSSVVLSYRRIFAIPLLKKITTVLLIFFAAHTVAFLVAAALQCNIRAWDEWYEAWTIQHHCTSAVLVWVGFSIVDVVTDLIVVCLPIPLVLGLHMKRSKQLATIAMFVLGSLSTAVGIARMGYLIHFTWSGRVGYRDLLGIQTTVLMWSIIEASVAILAASIPAIRRLLMESVFKSLERSSPLPSSESREAMAHSKGKQTRVELNPLR